MTSLFEHATQSRGGMPVDLITRGGRGVSLLTFVEEQVAPLTPAGDAVETEPEFTVDARAAQTAAMIAAAREEASAAARLACSYESDAALATERERVRLLMKQFASDRQRYFAAAESQVVRLAIAMARRILAREVEVDAMHLTATVRAALSRVQDGSTSTLRVRADDVAAWRAVFLADESVDVIADERVAAGECMLETSVGRVELGVAPQMHEMEQAFHDLTARQPE